MYLLLSLFAAFIATVGCQYYSSEWWTSYGCPGNSDAVIYQPVNQCYSTGVQNLNYTCDSSFLYFSTCSGCPGTCSVSSSDQLGSCLTLAGGSTYFTCPTTISIGPSTNFYMETYIGLSCTGVPFQVMSGSPNSCIYSPVQINGYNYIEVTTVPACNSANTGLVVNFCSAAGCASTNCQTFSNYQIGSCNNAGGVGILFTNTNCQSTAGSTTSATAAGNSLTGSTATATTTSATSRIIVCQQSLTILIVVLAYITLL